MGVSVDLAEPYTAPVAGTYELVRDEHGRWTLQRGLEGFFLPAGVSVGSVTVRAEALNRTLPEPGQLARGSLLLDLPMRQNNAAEAKTVREYLAAVLRAAWDQRAEANLIGDDDWYFDLFKALADAHALPAQIDDDGDVVFHEFDPEIKRYRSVFDQHRASDLIESAIEALTGG